jgi:glycosyltransferase involved in cell wall biosynthesis
MLSILIPVYNYNVTRLVHDLHSLASAAGIEFEIIIGDDCSSTDYQAVNQLIQESPNVRFLKMKQNSGRAFLRNRIAEKARFKWLLFLDADAGITNEKFLRNYIVHCRDEKLVVCGGTAYEENPPENTEFLLRWHYGKGREERPVSLRMKYPYRSFSAFNFLIPADIFEQIHFDENIRLYGHEDTLFGLELERNKVKILHVDNPALHLGLETAGLYLQKTREGVGNLLEIENKTDNSLIQKIKLLKYYRFFKVLGLSVLIRFLFKRYRRRLEKKLSSPNPSLYLFDLYKFGYIFSAD